jgi:hypothetical protein
MASAFKAHRPPKWRLSINACSPKISHKSPSPARLRERVTVRVLLPGSSCSGLRAFPRRPGAANSLLVHRPESEKRSLHPPLPSPATQRARGLRGARLGQEFFDSLTGAGERLVASRLLKKPSQPASPAVVSPASRRELQERSRFLLQRAERFLEERGFSAPC